MRFLPIFSLVPLAISVLSCSSEEKSEPVARADASLDGASGSDAGESQCPIPYPEVQTSRLGDDAYEGTCPAGCATSQAGQLDPATGCVVRALLCFPDNVGGGGLVNSCYKNVTDGRLVNAEIWALGARPGWVSCDGAEATKMKAGCK